MKIGMRSVLSVLGLLKILILLSSKAAFLAYSYVSGLVPTED